VDVRLTYRAVEIFQDHERVASHVRRSQRSRQKPSPASRQHILRRFVAVDMPNPSRPHGASLVAGPTEASPQELRRLCGLLAKRR
jgi:hypothetical protein